MAKHGKRSKKTSMCGCHGRLGLGKLSPFRKQPTGILTAESDSVDAIYDMVPSHTFGNNQAFDLWRTTPSGRTRLAQSVYHGDARRFATINEAALTRGRGVGGLWNWAPTTELGWVLSIGAVGFVAYLVLKRKQDIATVERSIAAENAAAFDHGPCPEGMFC